MRRLNVLIMLSIMSGLASAGMMGNGMGGMMGPQNSPPSPPPKNADPATRKGYNLTLQYCAQCHVPPNPNQHSAADWPQVVTRMQGYMQQQRRQVPSAAKRQLILEYLSKVETGHD
jgi:hypothetical protein